jgi:RNA polymerase sigma factor (sigma-70 family)
MNGIEQFLPQFRGHATPARIAWDEEEAAPLQNRLDRIGDCLDQLTERQREILRKVVDGIPNKAIALDLNISQRTVEKHREGIRQKMGVRSLAELVRTIVLYETFAQSADNRYLA